MGTQQPIKGRRTGPSSVLLRHDTPGKPAHLDWMLERPGSGRSDPPPSDDERRLIAFRLGVAADPLRDDAFAAHRIADHRAIYLHKQGDIGPGRGRVTRLWRADLLELSERDGQIAAAIGLGGAPVYLLGHRAGADLWRFVAEGGSGAGT